MKELIVEANYTEFRKRYASGRPFALISGFQGDMDVSQNKKNNITLRKKMKDQGYEVIRVLGGYIESGSFYESMIVFCDKAENYSEFIRFLMFFGKRYYQNSFFVVDPDNVIWEYSTRPDSTIGGVGKKVRYDKLLNGTPNELDALIEKYSKRTYQLNAIRVVTD